LIEQKVGPYEIVAKLGEGGMGEVYRARDRKLGRDVAIKVLPDAFTRDPDRLARFKREAQVLASLNHPNIAAIYGLEDSGSTHALVMELVEGEDLSALIARGPVPASDAISVARQIADALEAAHEQGIIHRDLKPANVKVRDDGRVKVLDFGLAKALDPAAASTAEAMNSPTLTAAAFAHGYGTPGTQMGVILGTAAYMSPEQARGKNVDRRADIWAFGVVLYELLTARRAFDGDDVSTAIASVLKDDVNWDALPGNLPTGMRRLLRRCLEKDPRRRLSSIGDARLELDEAGSGVSDVAAVSPAARATPRWQRALPWVLAGALAVALAVVVALSSNRAPVHASATHLQMGIAPAESIIGSEPNEIRVGGRRPSRTDLALSADGRWLVFAAQRGTTAQLYLRDLTRDQAAPIAGTEGGDTPFFSGDGKSIGFWSNGFLRRVPLEGGPVVDIAKTLHVTGASWGRDDTILFSVAGSKPLSRVSASGGQVTEVTTLDREAGETGHLLPHILPDGEHAIFTAALGRVLVEARVLLLSLKTGERRVLMEEATDGRYVASGHLVFMRRGTLMAAPFDLDRLAVTGPAAGIVDDVMVAVNGANQNIETGAGQFAVSSSGTLVYLTGGMLADSNGVLTWLDRQGKTTPLDVPSRGYLAPRISPDGNRIVAHHIGLERELWIYDIARDSMSKLRFDGLAEWPIWTPDGKRVAFRGHAKGSQNLYWMPVDGSSPAEPLTTGGLAEAPAAFTPDGKELVYSDVRPGTSADIMALSMEDRKTRPILQTAAAEMYPALSPDGRWLAYSSDDSGTSEVFVQAYRGATGRVQVSRSGGASPRWSRDGHELFYIEPTGLETARMKVVTVSTSPSSPAFSASAPKQIAELTTRTFGNASPLGSFDVAPDGRMIGVTREYNTPPPPTTFRVIVNWFEELRAKAPVK
jgi:serine/threonine-protein kinase